MHRYREKRLEPVGTQGKVAVASVGRCLSSSVGGVVRKLRLWWSKAVQKRLAFEVTNSA